MNSTCQEPTRLPQQRGSARAPDYRHGWVLCGQPVCLVAMQALTGAKRRLAAMRKHAAAGGAGPPADLRFRTAFQQPVRRASQQDDVCRFLRWAYSSVAETLPEVDVQQAAREAGAVDDWAGEREFDMECGIDAYIGLAGSSAAPGRAKLVRFLPHGTKCRPDNIKCVRAGAHGHLREGAC